MKKMNLCYLISVLKGFGGSEGLKNPWKQLALRLDTSSFKTKLIFGISIS